MSTASIEFIEGETEIVVRTTDGSQRRGKYVCEGKMCVGPIERWFIGIQEERNEYSTGPEIGTTWIDVTQIVFVAEVKPGAERKSVFRH